MGYFMVKEFSHILMETSMEGNGRMDSQMVKEQKLTLMEVSILGNGEMEICGTEHHTTKMETSKESL